MQLSRRKTASFLSYQVVLWLRIESCYFNLYSASYEISNVMMLCLFAPIKTFINAASKVKQWIKNSIRMYFYSIIFLALTCARAMFSTRFCADPIASIACHRFTINWQRKRKRTTHNLQLIDKQLIVWGFKKKYFYFFEKSVSHSVKPCCLLHPPALRVASHGCVGINDI